MPSHRILRAGVLIGLAVVLGRVLGFVREMTLARNFGASATADWAVLLFSFPDLVVNLLLGGALAAALIPEWSRQDPAQRRRLYHLALAIVGMSFALIAVAVWLGKGDIFALLAPGLDQSLASQGNLAFLFILVAIPLTALAGVTTAYSNFLGAVFIPALGTFVLNLFVIAGLLLAVQAEQPLVVFGASVCVGALVRWGLQLLNLRQTARASVAVSSTSASTAPTAPTAMKSLVARYCQVLASASLLLLVPVIARAYASSLGSGQMALMNYAQKLVELPVGIVVTVVSTLLLPRLSRFFAENAADAQITATFSSSVRWTFEISLAVLLPTLFYADAICNLLFMGSALQGEELRTIAALLAIGLFALPLQGLTTIVVCVYSAVRDTISPLLVSMLGIVLFLVGIRYAAQFFGLLGIAAAVLVFQIFVLLLLVIRMGRHIGVNYVTIVADVAFLRGVAVSVVVFFAMFAVSGQLDQANWFQSGWAMLSGMAMLLCIVLFNPNNKALVAMRGRTA